ncbi:alcohol dehydrogenase [Cavenderia fasciculata]|uniref:Alcohol dehydrogenase n=1 Tax=Cavenderia fasciculata TaxID=261658 RepID=F4PMH0_CACFS|nr:alcohol dehydrogenase [Cavenderia fasciculata]EGG23617.1 alcohol dehydrogenase [Cavenderia fasciculata]|eukprot:XP_004361468.1 alcohol dehydrogenase [Cavenderia fasciculata]
MNNSIFNRSVVYTTKKMKQIVITKNGSYDVLKVKESADPVTGEGQIKIQVKAAGLNFAEIMARQGLYPDAPPLPCVVGYEAAGIVTEVGQGVDSVKVGDRVIALSKFGAHSDTMIIPHYMAVPMPEHMSFAEGASIPVNFITAYHMLFKVARVQPGDSVLIHMAAGGVGVAAIQLCKTIKNVTVYGTASASKHDFIRELGCHHPIDYNTKDYVKEIYEINKDLPEGRRGIDIILDPLGDSKKSYSLLNPAVGRLVTFGASNFLSGSTRSIFNIASFSPLSLMSDNKMVAGVNIGHMFQPESLLHMLQEEMKDIMQLWVDGKVKAIVSKEFTFDDAGEAHRYMEERKNIGKIILVPTTADLTPTSSQ